MDYTQIIVDSINKNDIKTMIEEYQEKIDLIVLFRTLKNKDNWIWNYHSTENLQTYECIIPNKDLGVFAILNIEENTVKLEFF